MFVAMYIVQVARLLAQYYAVQSLVHEAVIVLDELPYQLRRHDLNAVVKAPIDQAFAKKRL